MRVLGKISFESVYLVWRVICRVIEYLYSFAMLVDGWFYQFDHRDDV